MRLLSGLHITIIIVIIGRWNILFGRSGLSILLGDSHLELIDGSLLKLLPHGLLFSEPRVPLVALTMAMSPKSGWRLWWILTLGVRWLSIGRRHFKHNIIKVVLDLLLLGVVGATTARGFGWILQLHVDELVVLQVHVLLDEVEDSLTEADLVVQTGWPHKRRWLSTVALGQLHCLQGLLVLLLVSLVELSNLDLLDVLVARVFKDDELMRDDSICYLLLLGGVQLIGVGDLMDLDLASVSAVHILVKYLGNVHLLLTA